MTVSVICEECGKVYHVPIAKLDQIEGDVVKTKCKECGHIIEIEKQAKEPQETEEYDSLANVSDDDISGTEFNEDNFNADDFDDKDFDNLEKAFQESAQEAAQEAAAAPQETAAKPGKKSVGKKGKRGMGLRAKMILLFMVVPLLLMSISGFLTQRQMNVLTADITQSSTQIVRQMAEANIAAIGQAVATQCKLYLDAHPNLKREDFASDPQFSKIAIQKVGKTGYTVLSSVGPFTAWVHPNPKLNGVVLSKVIKKLLGPNYPKFARIIAAADKGKNVKSRGYYLWKDADGKMREKFMTLTPVEGTDYSIAATTYLYEFTGQIDSVGSQADAVATASRNLNLITIAGTLVVIGLIVTLYGHSLVSKIRHLTDVADRISIGELDAEINIKSKDEIGNLADAITRMQDSLRLSIERLRKRR
jgi:HAMP domain-containing protein/cell division protein FtsL